MASLPELRLFHYLIKSIPGDLELKKTGSKSSKIGLGIIAKGFCDLTHTEAGALTSITLRAQTQSARDGVLQLEVDAPCRRCIKEGCSCVVFRERECYFCSNPIGCETLGHAKICKHCDGQFCPSCSVSGERGGALCIECGFMCSACSSIALIEEQVVCNSCSECELLCRDCALRTFEATFCGDCGEYWCNSCLEDFVCDICAKTYCFECTNQKQCIGCKVSAHERCVEEAGNVCSDCGNYNCADCLERSIGQSHLSRCNNCGVSLCSNCDEIDGCAAGDNCANDSRSLLLCNFCDAAERSTWSCCACNKTWCAGCVQCPECEFCTDSYCNDCSEMMQCTHCSNAAHGDICAWKHGNSCIHCGYCCNSCGSSHACVNCGQDICSVCIGDMAEMCPAGHMTCNSCANGVYEQCAAQEAKWGGVIENKSCPVCWEEAYAQLKGFDGAASFRSSKLLSNSLNGCLRCSPLLMTRLQFWGLGFYSCPGSTNFDTCSFLLAKLASMSAADKVNPRVVDEFVASLAVTHVFVWNNPFSVQMVRCILDDNLAVSYPVARHFANTANHVLVLAAGERIVSIQIRILFHISNLRLTSSTGAVSTFGLEWAPGVGTMTTYRVSVGWRLVGIFGNVGYGEHNLGVVIAKDPA